MQQTQGFFLNVSNYQPDPNLIDYGTWISDCIAMVTDSANFAYTHPEYCASQYYPATVGDFSTWGLTTAWYAQNMGNAVATTHFVIDTSRNGDGPNNMSSFANPPFNQPASVISKLVERQLVQPAGLRARAEADREHRRPAARRLPVGQDARPVRRPVRRRGRRARLGLHGLHAAGLADHRGRPGTVRPAVGDRRPGGRRLVPRRPCSWPRTPARRCPEA